MGPAAADDDPKYVPEQICCILVDGHTIEEVNQRWGTTTITADPEDNLYLIRAEGVEDLVEFVEDLITDPAIELAEVNWVLETPEGVRQMVIGMIGGTWEDFIDQSMTVRIGLEEAHLISRGEGVTVAVLDTGLDPLHEVFEDRLTEYRFDCLDDDHEPWEEANGIDDDEDGLIDEGYGHGTMVAGLVALVAPEARIMPIRVLNDEGCGTLYSVAKGFVQASVHGAHVINASFGTPTIVETIQQKLHVANVHGSISVAGAGNRNMEYPPYHPACDPLALMVTALDSSDVKAEFADFGYDVLVSAPGVGLRSAFPGGDWGLGSGCSFATPLVSGEVALLLSENPGMVPEAIATAVEGGIEPIYAIPGNEAYVGKLGSGRIHLPTALGAGAAHVPELVSPGLLTVHPNPSHGRLSFQMAGWERERSGRSLRLEVLDLEGRRVAEMDLPAVGGWVDLGGGASGPRLSTGVYYALIRGQRDTQRITFTILR